MKAVREGPQKKNMWGKAGCVRKNNSRQNEGIRKVTASLPRRKPQAQGGRKKKGHF